MEIHDVLIPLAAAFVSATFLISATTKTGSSLQSFAAYLADALPIASRHAKFLVVLLIIFETATGLLLLLPLTFTLGASLALFSLIVFTAFTVTTSLRTKRWTGCHCLGDNPSLEPSSLTAFLGRNATVTAAALIVLVLSRDHQARLLSAGIVAPTVCFGVVLAALLLLAPTLTSSGPTT